MIATLACCCCEEKEELYSGSLLNSLSFSAFCYYDDSVLSKFYHTNAFGGDVYSVPLSKFYYCGLDTQNCFISYRGNDGFWLEEGLFRKVAEEPYVREKIYDSKGNFLRYDYGSVGDIVQSTSTKVALGSVSLSSCISLHSSFFDLIEPYSDYLIFLKTTFINGANGLSEETTQKLSLSSYKSEFLYYSDFDGVCNSLFEKRFPHNFSVSLSIDYKNVPSSVYSKIYNISKFKF